MGRETHRWGIAAIANSTVPIFNVMLAPLMLPSERTTGIRLVGFVLGLVGVGVLSGAQPTVTSAFIVGTMAVVVASSIVNDPGALRPAPAGEAQSGPALATASMTGGALALLPLAYRVRPRITRRRVEAGGVAGGADAVRHGARPTHPLQGAAVATAPLA